MVIQPPEMEDENEMKMRIGTKIGGSDKNQDVYLGIFFGDDFSKMIFRRYLKWRLDRAQSAKKLY